MRKVKWVFFGYVAVVVLAVAAMAVAFRVAPARNADTFYAAYSGTIRTLDPAEIGDSAGNDIVTYVCEGLYNYRYKQDPYALYPELAAAMPDVSADGLTMTIKIRPGIHFYDPDHAIWPDGIGPEVTADDFVYSFKRVCDFNLASPNYSSVFQGKFQGLEDWWDYTQTHKGHIDWDRPVAGFTAPDHHTLVLRFSTPYPQMVYNLVNPPCTPVCRAIVDHWGDQVRLHPVGTGPYAMTEHLRDQRIVFTASPAYRGRPDVDGTAVVPDADRLPHVKHVQLDYFAEEMPVWLLFQQGLFDVEGIPKDAYTQAIGGGGDLTPAMTAKGIKLRKYPFPAVSYIGFNLNDPVLGKNKPLRQAMSMAFDRRAYIAKFLNGRGIPAVGPIPPGFPTYDARRVNPYTQFDLAKARELMREAERINGGPIPPLSILFRNGDTTARQMGEFDVDQMRQIGVTIVPQYRDFARWLEMVDSRQTQLFDGGWNSDYPDEQDFLQLFYGPNAPAGKLNSTAYVNPAFDKLYATATALPESPKRLAMYRQLEQMAEADCPWLILNYPLLYGLSYDWMGNRYPMDYGHGFMQYVTLDGAARARRLSHRN